MAAKAAYPVLVKVGTTSAGSFNTIGSVNSASFGPNFTELNISAISATIKSEQLLMGLSKGKSSVKCHYDSADTNGQNVMRTNWLSRTALYFQFLIDPSASAGAQGFKIKAFVSSMDVSADVDGVPSVSFSLAHSGSPVVDNGDADAA